MQEVEENYILCMKLCLCPVIYVISVNPAKPHGVTDVNSISSAWGCYHHLLMACQDVPRFNVKVELIPLFGTKEPDVVQDSIKV